MGLLSLILLSALSLCLAQAEDLQDCGGARYYASQYTCYDGNYLCPVMMGERTLRCGGGCYSPGMYSCDSNNSLQLLPPAQGPFTLQAVSSAAFNGQAVNACGRHFYVGGVTCTYCPEVVGPATCSGFPNTTVLFPGSGMSVWVPGGQQYYVEPNGALGFTQAHSAGYPTGSSFGSVGVYEDGWFYYTGGATATDGWLACPTEFAGIYQVFGKIAGVTFNSSCVPLNIRSIDVADGTAGAWQYT